VANCDLYLLVDDEGVWHAARPGETAQLFVGEWRSAVAISAGQTLLPRVLRDSLDSSSPTGGFYRTVTSSGLTAACSAISAGSTGR